MKIYCKVKILRLLVVIEFIGIVVDIFLLVDMLEILKIN